MTHEDDEVDQLYQVHYRRESFSQIKYFLNVLEEGFDTSHSQQENEINEGDLESGNEEGHNHNEVDDQVTLHVVYDDRLTIRVDLALEVVCSVQVYEYLSQKHPTRNVVQEEVSN